MSNLQFLIAVEHRPRNRKPPIGGNPGTVALKVLTAAKTDLQKGFFGFTRRVTTAACILMCICH